jgi:Xaa-Pro dipeptidase
VLEAGVDMRYFTGVRWGLSERPLLVALPARGVPFFVGPAFERSRLEESVPTGMELVAWEEHEDPYETLVALARKRGVDPRGLAVGGTTRRFVADGLARAAARSSLLSGGAFVDAARIVKSEHELARLRRVNEATKAAIAAARPLVEPGMTEGELVTLFTAAQRAAGLDEIWVLALVGANAAFPHGTAHGRVVREGEVVLVDTGGALHGYRSDITRTFVVGRANDEVKRAYDTVLAAQSAGLALIRPGEACQRADAAAREVMAAAGYGAGYERFTHRLGHGIGLEVHEPPYLVRGNELVLATGMTMSNEPGIYVPGQFGIRIEDIVAVGAEGPEVFGPRALPLGSD